jgi:hypothetical protein
VKRALTENDLACQYEVLRQRLAQIGYITQGSVLERSRLTPPWRRLSVDPQGGPKDGHRFLESGPV